MTAPEQLAESICQRFDHLKLARLRDVKNAEQPARSVPPELAEIRGGRMETWYDDLPQGFLQGGVGQDPGSMRQQVGRRMN